MTFAGAGAAVLPGRAASGTQGSLRGFPAADRSSPRLRPSLTRKLGSLLTSESLILLTPRNLRRWHGPKIPQMLDV